MTAAVKAVVNTSHGPRPHATSPILPGMSGKSGKPTAITLTIMAAILIGEIGLIFSGALTTTLQVAVVCLALLLTLMAWRVPIAVAMGIVKPRVL